MKNIETNTIKDFIANGFIQNIVDCIEGKETTPLWQRGFWNAKVFNFKNPNRQYQPYNLVLMGKFLENKTPCLGTREGWTSLNYPNKGRRLS